MKKDIIYLIIQFLLFAVYFIDWEWYNYEFPLWLSYSSLVFVVFGLLIILFGILNLNENISPFLTPKGNSALISSGIYKYIRHPIYSGIIIAMFFYAIYTASPLRFLITIVLTVVLYFKINLEEKLLINRYAEYKAYRDTTGRFFPRIKNKKA